MKKKIIINLELIRSKRKIAKLSQLDMARSLGMGRTTYINLEEGRRDLTLMEAYQVSKLFDIDIENLIDDPKKKDTKMYDDLIKYCNDLGNHNWAKTLEELKVIHR